MNSKHNPKTLERRRDIASILWVLLAQKRRMMEWTSRQKGILLESAWDGVDGVEREIKLVLSLVHGEPTSQ